MELRLLSDVRQTDGPTFGELRHVVCDRSSLKVLSLVVQRAGLEEHAVIVPIDVVSSADDDAVLVDLDEEQLHGLQPYAFSENIAPPPADVADDVESADIKEDFIQVPNVPPVGAAQGITTIAFTPIIEVWRNVPEGSAVIGDKTDVVARDGKIGDVERLVLDDQSFVLTSLVVQSVGLTYHTFEIPADLIETLESARIEIGANRSDFVDLDKNY